jgi:hypothetical protein
MLRVVKDPLLSEYFKGINMDLHNEKLVYYVSYLAGGHQHWIG